jgi:hypothetical protein
MPERLLDQNESLDHLICGGETLAQAVNVFGVVIIEDIRVVVILDSVTNVSAKLWRYRGSSTQSHCCQQRC